MDHGLYEALIDPARMVITTEDENLKE